MMRILICLMLLCACALDQAQAQWRRPGRSEHRERVRVGSVVPVEFGVRAGHDFHSDGGLAGAQLRVPLIPQLLLVPSADVFFGEDEFGRETQWQVNADVALAPRELGGLYLGAGAAFVSRDFDGDGNGQVEAGYNLLAGLQGRSLFDLHLRPFVEARWTRVEDHRPFRLSLGINVPVR